MTNWREVTLDSSSDVWDREDPIEGTFVGVREDVGPNESKLYTIKTDKGEVKVWGSTVLDDKLMGVPQGSKVRIEYEGKLKSKKGTQYHSYRVFIDTETEPEDEEGQSKLAEELNEIFPPDEDEKG